MTDPTARDRLRVQLEEVILASIRDATDLDVELADFERPLLDVGLDSLVLVEVLYAVEEDLGLRLEPEQLQELAHGETVSEFVDIYLRSVEAAPPGARDAPATFEDVS